MAITLTDRAVGAVREAMTTQGMEPETAFVRVSVTGGGCSGMGYTIALTPQKNDDDQVFDCDGVRVVCDPSGYEFLRGTEIDYHESMVSRGFAFNNPNARGSCGCGKSFSV
jgi:iron-sulfur cluster assembly protein